MIDPFLWQKKCIEMMRNSTSTACQEDSSANKQQQLQKSVITPDTNNKKSVIKKKTRNTLEDEVKILSGTYGEFTAGTVLEIDLPEAYKLLGKTRKRVDTFNSLAKYLQDNYQVTLKITSRKSK